MNLDYEDLEQVDVEWDESSWKEEQPQPPNEGRGRKVGMDPLIKSIYTVSSYPVDTIQYQVLTITTLP
jgi:hypothetical protein